MRTITAAVTALMLCLTFPIALVLPHPISAYAPIQDGLAVEVLLNKPGVSWDLSAHPELAHPNRSSAMGIGFAGTYEWDTVAQGEHPLLPMAELLSYPGAASGFREEAHLVVRSQEEWQALLDRMGGNAWFGRDPPVVDFSEQMVVAAFMGMRPTSGYSIAIDAVFEHDGAIVVNVKTAQPNPDLGQLAVLTYPLYLAAVPRSDAPVIFQGTRSEDGIPGTVYRSHLDARLGVILTEQRLAFDGPRYLTIRVQVPTSGRYYWSWQDGRQTLTEDIGPDPAIDLATVDLQEALRLELAWLRRQGIITRGIGNADIEHIGSLAVPGAAGFSERIVYHDGAWSPYRDTGLPALKANMSSTVLRNSDLPPTSLKAYYRPGRAYVWLGLSIAALAGLALLRWRVAGCSRKAS